MCKPDDFRLHNIWRFEGNRNEGALLHLIGIIEHAAKDVANAEDMVEVHTNTNTIGHIFSFGDDDDDNNNNNDNEEKPRPTAGAAGLPALPDSHLSQSSAIARGRGADDNLQSGSLETMIVVSNSGAEEIDLTAVPDLVPATTKPVAAERKRHKKRGAAASSRTTTKKGLQRGHVQHNYHDHASELANDGITGGCVDQALLRTANNNNNRKRNNKGGVSTPFPIVLHDMLERADVEGFSDIVSWQPHGRAFLVRQKQRFVAEIMPRFFRQTRFSSFQRQLSLYGFLRLTRKGLDHGAYYHELFLCGRPHLCQRMQRTRVKGCRVRQSSSPETEPEFSTMTPVTAAERIRNTATITTTTSTAASCSPVTTAAMSPDTYAASTAASTTTKTMSQGGLQHPYRASPTTTVPPLESIDAWCFENYSSFFDLL